MWHPTTLLASLVAALTLGAGAPVILASPATAQPVIAVAPAVNRGWPASPALPPITASGPGGALSPGSAFESRFAIMTVSQQAAVISLMRADGVRWLRIDVTATFPYDALTRQALASGMHVDALVDDWATPDTPAAMSALGVAVVRHLAPLGVDTYEVLNEVNTRMSAATYTPLLRAPYLAIKMLEPSATVLTAGLAPGAGSQAPATYLEAMYQAGAKGSFDGVAVHPYSYPDLPTQPDAWNTFYALPLVEWVLAENGDSSLGVWITEFGCPTGTSGGFSDACTDATLAQQITAAFSQARAWGWVRQLFIYSWQDDNVAGDGDFGLYTARGQAKSAALTAFELAADTDQ